MAPLTLDSLLHGGEPEDSCEDEFSGSDDDSGEGSEECGRDVDGDDDPYSPAESLWLRIGEDIDWSEVGAVLEREDSTKGASNPKSACARSTSSCCPAPAARTSKCAGGGGGTATATATKAVAVVVIAGLPAAAAGKASREHVRRRRRLCRARARVFDGEEAVEIAEPGSPRVSCLGGVRSRAPPPPQQQPYCPAWAAGMPRWRRRRWWSAWLVGVACRRCWSAPPRACRKEQR